MSKYVDVENINVSDYVTVWECSCSEYGKQEVMAIDDVFYLPAADVVEVKHGKWEVRTVRGEAELYCSVCGNSPNVIYAYEFCPSCGAKMDLED